MTGERLSYRFGPLERRGLLGQLRGGQAAAVATGAAAAILVLDRAPSAGGAFLGTLFAGRLGADRVRAARPPHRSRNGRRSCSRFALRLLARPAQVPLARAGRRDAGNGAPRAVAAAAPPSSTRCSARDQRRPDPRRALPRSAGRRPERASGAPADRRCSRAGCVAFSLLDAEAQERRLARWGAGPRRAPPAPSVRRIQWIERTAPAQGDEFARWLHAERDPAVPLQGHADDRVLSRAHRVDGPGHPGARDPSSRAGRRAWRFGRLRHLGPARADRARRTGTRGGGGQGPRSAGRRPALAGAAHGVRSLRPRRARGARDGRPRAATASPRRTRGRSARARHWDHYRSDGAVHATYWIGALAAGRRLADVHGRPAGSVQRRSGRSRSRSSRSPATGPPARSRPPSPATTPTASFATASGRPRPPAIVKRRRRRCAARPSSPPATRRSGWRGS